MKYIRIGLLSFLFTVCLQSSGQTFLPLGNWKYHGANNHIRDLLEKDNKIYALTDAGIFTYSISDKEIELLNSLNGLRNVTINSIGIFGSDVAVGYVDGVIDLITDSGIIQLNAIFESQFSNKQINEIATFGDEVLVSTNFGLVIFNAISKNVKGTYWQLGPNGEVLTAKSAAKFNNELFISTSSGILKGLNDGSINLLDFNNWERNVNILDPKKMVFFNGDLYLLSPVSGLLFYELGNWNTVFSPFESLSNISIIESGIVVIGTDNNWIWDGNSISEMLVPEVNDITCALSSSNINFWGTNFDGVYKSEATSVESILPGGPLFNSSWQIQNSEDKLIAVKGGVNSNFGLLQSPQISINEKGKWSNYSATTVLEWNGLKDFTSATSVDNSLFIASYGSGLVTYDLTLATSEIQQVGGGYDLTSITEIKSSGDGLWMISLQPQISLIHRSNEDVWKSFPLNNNLIMDRNSLLVTNKNVFVLSRTAGIIVLNKSTGQLRYLSQDAANGKLPGYPLSMEIDTENNLWVGTTNGVAYFSNFSFEILKEAILPIFENSYLLRGVDISVIKIDAGKRFWMGSNEGVWLFDKQFNSQLSHFTTANSPLISNNIIDIETVNGTGEVFFSTDKGLLSFGSDASKAKENFKSVKIYPNPVYPGYKGLVGISGLKDRTIVKVIDSYGKLVDEFESNGGLASWNTTNSMGELVSSGVYFFMISEDSGGETAVGKLLIVR